MVKSKEARTLVQICLELQTFCLNFVLYDCVWSCDSLCLVGSGIVEACC